MAPKGTIVISEFLVNQDRTGPPMGLIFAVNMLAHTESGDTYLLRGNQRLAEGSRPG